MIPIYKNRDKHCMENYRPISLLPQFSKVLEKLFVKQLNLFIHKNKLLSENQYGFRESRTTAFAVMQMVIEISNANENGVLLVCISICRRLLIP